MTNTLKTLKITATIFCLILGLSTYAQNSEDESFYPLTKGLSKSLTWYNSIYREVIKDTIHVNGKIYTEVSQIFPPKKEINIYVRKSNDTIYFFNELKKTEMAFFGIAEKVGQTIGNGTVKEINATLKTPKGKLTDLLVIDMKYGNGSKDTRYYQKGLGLVAVKSKNKLICYYVPD